MLKHSLQIEENELNIRIFEMFKGKGIQLKSSSIFKFIEFFHHAREF